MLSSLGFELFYFGFGSLYLHGVAFIITGISASNPFPLLFLFRGGMIQTSEQYQFVHHVMSLFEKQFSRAAKEE